MPKKLMSTNKLHFKLHSAVGFVFLQVTLFIFSTHLLSAQERSLEYPKLTTLNPITDPIYKQQQADLEAVNIILHTSSPNNLPSLVLYSFTVHEPVEIFWLAARLNLPVDSIASLNHINRSIGQLTQGQRILVPSIPGIFVPVKPSNDLEILLAHRSPEGAQKITLIGTKGRENFYFYPGDRFTSIERSMLFNYIFRLPLDKGIMTSNFGMRTNPVTGHYLFHEGIDLASPLGSKVYAVRDGVIVRATTGDKILGNYIIIDHGGNFQTVYGHLSQILVQLNQKVISGTIIGLVGSTGQSTGPHLHFEVHEGGKAVNPEAYIPQKH